MKENRKYHQYPDSWVARQNLHKKEGLILIVDQYEKKLKSAYTVSLVCVNASAMDPAKREISYTQIMKGGTKKFLYSGAKKDKQPEEEWSFAPKVGNKPTGVPVDLENVWSIQKNVSLGGLAPKTGDRLTQNASKGFYSRHGGMKDNAKNQKPPEKSDVGSAWGGQPRGNSFSYSYGTGGGEGGDDSSSIASSRVSRGYRSNPTPRRFDGRQQPLDENDF